MPTTGRRPRRAVPTSSIVALVFIVMAVSLVIASTAHLAGAVHGRGGSFDAHHAGIAEAVIAAVLIAASTTMWRTPKNAKIVGLAAATFAIAGFLVGLRFTLGGGHLPDITYHLIGLPILVGALIALWRTSPGQCGASRGAGVDNASAAKPPATGHDDEKSPPREPREGRASISPREESEWIRPGATWKG
jgi:hypothetical protein